jgi:hypothetical protein
LAGPTADDDRFLDLALGAHRPGSGNAFDGVPGRPRQIRSADEFITVLMSDEEIAENKIILYQRLLARDQDEAAHIVAEYLRNQPRERLYDELLLPALKYARLDRKRGRLTEVDEQSIFRATREIVMKLDSEQTAPPHPIDPEESVGGDPRLLPKMKILGCPAKDEADEVALLMS